MSNNVNPDDDTARFRQPINPIDTGTSNNTTHTYYYKPRPPRFGFEHVTDSKRFRLTDTEGKVSEFHDQPVRFLVVEPDPETGEPRPVLSRGEPKILFLCREEGP